MVSCHLFSHVLGLWNFSAGFRISVSQLTLKRCLWKERKKKCIPTGGFCSLSSHVPRLSEGPQITRPCASSSKPVVALEAIR